MWAKYRVTDNYVIKDFINIATIYVIQNKTGVYHFKFFLNLKVKKAAS